ncbi:MAG: hypothetical protein R3F24_07725 [Gammaproteobacteria bacterium]
MKSLAVTGRIAALLFAGLSLNTTPLLAASGNPGGWEFAGELYIWGAEMDSTTPGGTSITLPFDTILDNLEMTFMGVIAARKDKWTFSTDLIYMDLSHRKDFGLSVPSVTGSAKAELTSWIITPMAAYNIRDDGKIRIDVLGGLRYVDIDAKLNLNLDGPRPAGFETSARDSFSDWNGILGAKGRLNLTDHWYAGAYGDIGTGESDLTWQAVGLVGYRFNTFELNAGYRYLDFEFDKGDNNLMDELAVKGPFAGGLFRF